MKKRTKLPAAVLLLISAVIVVLSLLASAKLAEVEDRSEKLKKETALLEQRNRLLQAQCENLVSIEELERYAIEQLGMQRLSPGQVFYLETDDVVIG